MEELSKKIGEWGGRGIFLLRIDYGYDPPCRVGVEADCSSLTRGEVANMASFSGTRGILRLTSPQYAFSPRRRGEGGGEMLTRLVKNGTLVETRFLKTFRSVAAFLQREKTPFLSHDAKHDGSLPPLYRRIRHSGELFGLHLLYEWETGLGMARGASVIVEAGSLMSKSEGPLSAGSLAKKMGITLGAAASYLKWMEDATLVRRSGGGYMLRHEGLYSLFGGPPGQAVRAGFPRKSDPMELD